MRIASYYKFLPFLLKTQLLIKTLDIVLSINNYSGSQIDEVQQQQSANNSQGLVVYLSYSRTAISLEQSFEQQSLALFP